MECQIDMPDRLSDGMNWMPWWGSLEAKYFFNYRLFSSIGLWEIEQHDLSYSQSAPGCWSRAHKVKKMGRLAVRYEQDGTTSWQANSWWTRSAGSPGILPERCRTQVALGSSFPVTTWVTAVFSPTPLGLTTCLGEINLAILLDKNLGQYQVQCNMIFDCELPRSIRVYQSLSLLCQGSSMAPPWNWRDWNRPATYDFSSDLMTWLKNLGKLPTVLRWRYRFSECHTQLGYTAL